MESLDLFSQTIKHLPELSALKTYPIEHWAVFGTLTYRYQNCTAKIRDDFRHLIYEIAAVNDSWPERLIWLMRVERGHPNSIKSGLRRRHAHFALGDDRVINGKYVQFSKAGAASFLTEHWKLMKKGTSIIEEYDPSRDGIEYILKAPLGIRSADYEDLAYPSPRLNTLLKKETNQPVFVTPAIDIYPEKVSA